MKCGSHRRCVQLAMFFHSAGGTANLFSSTIYGSKQDANSGIEVVCHMQVDNLVVLTKSFSQDHKFRANISPSSSGKLKWRTLNLSLNHKLLPVDPSIHPSDRLSTKCVRISLWTVCTYCRYKELLDLLHCSPHLDLCSCLCVFHCDEDMKVFIQVFPVWLPSVLLLLDREIGRARETVSECDSVGVLEYQCSNTAYQRKWRREAGIHRGRRGPVKRGRMTGPALQSAIQL